MMSPRYAAKTLWRLGDREPDPNELPALRIYSDLMWGAWNINLAPEKLANIRYYFSMNVINWESEGIISRAIKSVDAGMRPWPGITFDMESEGGRALLGSPNGRVIGYMLGQRKLELGRKIVKKVHVFHSNDIMDTMGGAMLAFKVENVASKTHVEVANLTVKSN